MEWYYANESDQQITFDEENFAGLVEIGTIKKDTLVWNEAMDDWQEAGSVKPDLFALTTTSSSPEQVTADEATTTPPSLANHGPGPGAPPQQDGLAIASLVCSIIGVLLSCGYGLGLFPGIAGVICGHMSKKKTNAQGLPNGMATAGLITGYIAIAVSILMGIVMIVAIGAAVASEM